MREASIKAQCHICGQFKRCKLVQTRATPDSAGRLFELVCAPCARPLLAMKKGWR